MSEDKEKSSSKFHECRLCGRMVHEYNVIISPYNDSFCKRCDEVKKKFPMKTHDQLLPILPPADDEDGMGGVNMVVNVIVVLIIAFMIYLFL